jgi:tetratricopeptide (TPR) repeat protein
LRAVRGLLKLIIAVVAVCAAILPLTLAVGAEQRTASSATNPPDPIFTANKLAILAQLRQKNFAALDSEFDGYQKAFESDPKAELNEEVAFESFATDDEAIQGLITEWIKARRGSFAAHMAMGSYCSWRGWHSRGPGGRSGAPGEQSSAMKKFFAASVGDIRTALKLRPKLSVAYGVLIGEARGQGIPTQAIALQAEALQQVPASFVVREQLMVSFYPRWGGNHDLMTKFADQSQSVVKQNPYVHWLLGFVDLDDGETFGIQGQFDKSIAALSDAIKKGGDFWRFYSSRGVAYLNSGAFDKALNDFNRANQLSPQDPDLLTYRAAALLQLGKPKEALADLEVVKVFAKPDQLWNQLHDAAVKLAAARHH